MRHALQTALVFGVMAYCSGPAFGQQPQDVVDWTAQPSDSDHRIDGSYDYNTLAVGGGSGFVNFTDPNDDACNGYVSSAPHVTFTVSAPGSDWSLNMEAHAWDGESHILLLLRDPGGEFYCSDDQGGPSDPGYLVEDPDGFYALWIGTDERSTTNITIHFSVQ